MENKTALVKLVEKSGLDKTRSDYIIEKFQDFDKIAEEWRIRAETLVITSENDIAGMKMAR